MVESVPTAVSQLLLQHDTLVTCSSDGTATVWDWRTRAPVAVLPAGARKLLLRGNILFAAPAAPDHALGDITAWDLRAPAQPVALLRGHTGAVHELLQSVRPALSSVPPRSPPG